MNERRQWIVNRSSGFSLIELLVVIGVIGVLTGVTLPVVSGARERARIAGSHSNLRNLAAAQASYASSWNDRQLTLISGTIASLADNPFDAFREFTIAHAGKAHPPIRLGWGHNPVEGYGHWVYPLSIAHEDNFALAQPIAFDGVGAGFGAFRLPNVAHFNQYVDGRFYNPVFYAPNDSMVLAAAEPAFDDPSEYSFLANVDTTELGAIPAWSSYCLSPAGMFAPDVMRHHDPQDSSARGFRDPWSMAGGFRSPTQSQARFSSLKTQMLEHHWLQNRRAECNRGFEPGTYQGCEPYYFNHASQSTPVALFFDGHIDEIGVRQAMAADGRIREQTGHDDWGLWSRDTPFDEDGYMHELGYDHAETSFHILTTDGIQGRDIVGE